MHSVKSSGKLAALLLWQNFLEFYDEKSFTKLNAYMYTLFFYSFSFDSSLWWPLLLSMAAIKGHVQFSTPHQAFVSRNSVPQHIIMFLDSIITTPSSCSWDTRQKIFMKISSFFSLSFSHFTKITITRIRMRAPTWLTFRTCIRGLKLYTSIQFGIYLIKIQGIISKGKFELLSHLQGKPLWGTSWKSVCS